MFEALLIGAVLIGLVAAASSSDKTGDKGSGSGSDDKTGDKTGDKTECIYGDDKPVEKLPQGVRNAVIAALTVETDPKELENFAVQLEKICQPTAAKALRAKKTLLEQKIKAANLPVGTDLGTLPPLSYPEILGGTPMPPVVLSPSTGLPIPNDPPPSDAFEKLTAEPIGAPLTPKADCQSLPTTQWWTGPYNGKCTITAAAKCGLFYLAEAITGNGLKYVEIIQANPEKFSIGDPSNPMLTGYSFAAGIADGERLRIPKSWNPMIDQTGESSGGSVYEFCMPELSGPFPTLDLTELPAETSPLEGDTDVPPYSLKM